MTEDDWIKVLFEIYDEGFTDGHLYGAVSPFVDMSRAYAWLDRIKSKGGTLPVESVEDPSEYLPTNSTQTPPYRP